MRQVTRFCIATLNPFPLVWQPVPCGYTSLVKPSCLIVGEVERCTFDKAYIDLFYGIVDSRLKKD